MYPAPSGHDSHAPKHEKSHVEDNEDPGLEPELLKNYGRVKKSKEKQKQPGLHVEDNENPGSNEHGGVSLRPGDGNINARAGRSNEGSSWHD